jgi:arginine/ornithine permease
MEGGKVSELKFKTPLYPLVPLLSLFFNTVVIVSLAFIPKQRMALYCGIPFMIMCYAYYYIAVKKKSKNTIVNTIPDEKKKISI